MTSNDPEHGQRRDASTTQHLSSHVDFSIQCGHPPMSDKDFHLRHIPVQ